MIRKFVLLSPQKASDTHRRNLSSIIIILLSKARLAEGLAESSPSMIPVRRSRHSENITPLLSGGALSHADGECGELGKMRKFLSDNKVAITLLIFGILIVLLFYLGLAP